MASLVLGSVGTAIGGPILGAIGSMAGQWIDGTVMGMLFPPKPIEGPRISDTSVTTSTEGAPIPRIYGYSRTAGQIIWASNFKEEKVSKSVGGGSGSGGQKQKTVDYSYKISFAVGLCEGVISRVGRIWANGAPLDKSEVKIRVYRGTETQNPDPLIVELEGADKAPGYRGLAYVVFEDFEVTEDYGNRIPTMQFEIIRSSAAYHDGSPEYETQAVVMIPGCGEFVYATETVTQEVVKGQKTAINSSTTNAETDIEGSLYDLQNVCPNLDHIALTVSWFGNDLRAGNCQIKPNCEYHGNKRIKPKDWSVDGITRENAEIVSSFNSAIAFGGTPADWTVVQSIKEIKRRGKAVTFYPFLQLDIPANNTLPNPYSDNAASIGQAGYPWRGRITCSPAPGYVGTPNKTSTASAQVGGFFGSAVRTDFNVSGEDVAYTGSTDWGYRRFILHYAHLCKAAGGVDAFLIGSELVGLTRVRSSSSAYPAISQLTSLLTEVRAILGNSTKIGYAADWSDWNCHQTGDAAGEVYFNLDPLWSHAELDFIGVDNYLPLSDWKDGTNHLDYNDFSSGRIHNEEYLASNIEGGELYDWYYIDQNARDIQARVAITDGAYNKPWVWRQKDFKNWWSNYHYNRPNGVQSSSPTSWVPRSKPIWFTELGCPAIDKGSNQPNAFIDAKSSDSLAPYNSIASRDDLIQRLYIQSQQNYWKNNSNNPLSNIYSGRMIDTARIYLWTWDARPFPFFPALEQQWGDTENYFLGHWLNGRLGSAPVREVVNDICRYHRIDGYSLGDIYGLVTGYQVNRPMTARNELEPLMQALHFDAFQNGDKMVFKMRGAKSPLTITTNDIAVDDDDDTLGVQFTRGQETTLPIAYRVTYLNAAEDYRQGVVESRRLTGSPSRIIDIQMPLMMDQFQAQGIGDRTMQEAWVQRETASFSLRPNLLQLVSGDELNLVVAGVTRRLRITSISDTGKLDIEAVRTAPHLYEPFVGSKRKVKIAGGNIRGGFKSVFIAELPMLTPDSNPYALYAGAHAKPWTGAVSLMRSPTTSGFVLDTLMPRHASLGETLTDLYAGPEDVYDMANTVTVAIYYGTLRSVSDAQLSTGANSIAVENSDGGWEILQFGIAKFVAKQTYELSRLVRGRRGSEKQMRFPVQSGARVIVLDSDVYQTALDAQTWSLSLTYFYDGETTETIKSKGVGLKPYSPVYLNYTKATNGNYTITWIRRDRIAGDNWDDLEVPMSEAVERYYLDFYAVGGNSAIRTVIVNNASTYTYTASNRSTDFGTDPFVVLVSQYSTKVGRGSTRRLQIDV